MPLDELTSTTPALALGLGLGLGLDLGLVIAGHGRHYVVEIADGSTVRCGTRGKKSDCVVGDRVRWKATDEKRSEGVIEAIEPRRCLLHRQDEWRTKSFAANLDRLVMLVASEPPFSESQLTRALIAAEHAGISATIVLNKIDLIELAEVARKRLAPYLAMGYDVIEVALKPRLADDATASSGQTISPAADQSVSRSEVISEVISEAANQAARDRLLPLLSEGATLVLGPSGTGKSTLVNLLVPNADAQVGEISTALNAGRHTTTHTRWYWLDAEHNGALIDSPGFQEFGLHHVPITDLARHMPDLVKHADHCRFANCTHDHEPGCGVLEALAKGEISPSRHRIYLELREELSRKKY